MKRLQKLLGERGQVKNEVTDTSDVLGLMLDDSVAGVLSTVASVLKKVSKKKVPSDLRQKLETGSRAIAGVAKTLAGSGVDDFISTSDDYRVEF